MLQLLSKWRMILVLGLGLVCGVLGWQAHSSFVGSSIPTGASSPTTQTVEKLVVRTVTVIKKPDGTTTTVTEDREQTASTSKPVPRSRYAVEVGAEIDPAYPLRKPDYSITGWKRLGESDVWAGAGWDFGKKAVLAGMRVEF